MNMSRVVAFLVVISLHKVVCDDVFTNISGSQVMFVNQRMTFEEAETNCKGKGATLVEMWTLEEWKEISEWFGEQRVHRRTAVWIGLTDIMKEGTFLWISGRNFSSQIGNISWEDGQPNNFIGNQHCAGLYGKVPKMFDMSCSSKYHSVCQKREAGPVTVVTQNQHHGNTTDQDTIDQDTIDQDTIVHLVVGGVVIMYAICVVAFSVRDCSRVSDEQEWHPSGSGFIWKGLASERAEDTIPLHEMEVEFHSTLIDVIV